MRPERPPRLRNLPDIPYGCDELQATTDPDSFMSVSAQMKDLPGLDHERFGLLEELATQSPPSGPDDDPPESEPVLGLEDLVRINHRGFYALHPRVQLVVSLWAIDPLIEAIGTRLETGTRYAAYQYPAYAMECRGSAPEGTTLHPPEYHINAIDVLRELRANDILTAVCRPGDTVPGQGTIRATFESMEQRRENVNAAFTLVYDGTSSQSPTIAFHDGVVPDSGPEESQLFDLVSTRCRECRADLRLRSVSDLSSKVRSTRPRDGFARRGGGRLH